MPVKAYISGPMTGKPFDNFHAFFNAEEDLEHVGYGVVNPARMDFEQWGWPGREGYVGLDIDRRTLLWKDFQSIFKMNDWDIIVLLPGWEDSTGAVAEKALADALGMKTMTLEEAMQ